MKTPNKKEEIKFVPEDYTFYPDGNYGECKICGICSFSHFHKSGNLPKDFKVIEDGNKKEECKHPMTTIGLNGQMFCQECKSEFKFTPPRPQEDNLLKLASWGRSEVEWEPQEESRGSWKERFNILWEGLFSKKDILNPKFIGNPTLIKSFISSIEKEAVEAERERIDKLIGKIIQESNHHEHGWYDALRCVRASIKSSLNDEKHE